MYVCVYVCAQASMCVPARVCVFPTAKAEMNVCLSVMNLLNLRNTGVLELQGLPYAAQDRARGDVCKCVHVRVCLHVCVWLG